MPSGRRSKRDRPHRPLATGHPMSRVTRRGRFLVRGIPGQSATKEYRCPGCDQVIGIGVAHVVVWPENPSLAANNGIEERRHWHTGCWQRLGS